MNRSGTPEIEIKLDLQDVENYNKFLEYLNVKKSPIYHLNVYFDSPDQLLSKAGWALRIRVLDDSGLITAKNSVVHSDKSRPTGLAVREEIETVVSHSDALDLVRGKIDLLNFSSTPTDFIRDNFSINNLIKKVKFQNYRVKKHFLIQQQDLFFELDRTIYSSENIEYELEIELSDESQYAFVVDWVGKLFLKLSIPFKFQDQSKLKRALDLMVESSQ